MERYAGLIIKVVLGMFCMCCKMRHASSSRLSETVGTSRLELPTLSPMAKNPLNPDNDLFDSFKSSSEDLLYSLLEKEVSAIKGLSRDSRLTDDLEETSLSDQTTEDEKLYRVLFRRIYIENYTAERLIKEDIRLLERVYYPESMERILIETMDRAAIIYRSILKEKVEDIVACTTLGCEVNLRDFFHYFEEVIEIMNLIIDYSNAIRTYSREADSVLRYLQANNMIDPLHDIHEEWLHRRCIRTVLQDTFLKSICALARSILATNALAKYESKIGVSALNFMVDCCFSEEDSELMLLSRSCTQFPAEDDEDQNTIRLMNNTQLSSARLQCQFTPKFLKNIERKVRKCK